MSAANKHREASISQSVDMALVLPRLESLPDTFLSTLGKALFHAVAIDGCLLLPVDSLQITLRGGIVVTGPTLVNFVLPLSNGCISLVETHKAMLFSGPDIDETNRS